MFLGMHCLSRYIIGTYSGRVLYVLYFNRNSFDGVTAAPAPAASSGCHELLPPGRRRRRISLINRPLRDSVKKAAVAPPVATANTGGGMKKS